MPDYTFVDRPDALVPILLESSRVGLDTEFMREKTFFAELCLVQVATGSRIHCVDPLQQESMAAFWNALLSTECVLHSGRQDIEVVYQTAGRMPDSVFDTQIAAGLLGHPPQMGYANLVKELFDTDLDKSHTRADWSRRPLPDAWLHYAAEDVEFLLPMRDLLAERLDAKDRLRWAVEDSAGLLDPALYETSPESAIDRLKGARNLRGQRHAVAARLASWREAEALRVNRPRQWILRDSVLLELAQRQPGSVRDLGRIDGLPGSIVRRSGKAIVDTIARAGSGAAGPAPIRPPDDTQRSLLKSMQKKVSECAAELGLAAETLASRRDLAAVIVNGERDSRLLSGWRRELIGNDLLASL